MSTGPANPIARRGRRARGFSLIEALVAAAVMGTGVVSATLAMGSLARREATIRQQEVMQRLAQRKLDEILVTTSDLTVAQTGDFKDWNQPNYTWSTKVDTTGVDNLDAITLTVTPASGGSNTLKATACVTVYIPPNTSSTTTSAGGN